MQKCSYFIEGKALFGSFPTQEEVDELEMQNVRVFVDLTYEGEEKTTPYMTKYSYVKYTIKDHKIPEDWKTFAVFIMNTSETIKKLRENEKIYVHCKGGHGRSGIVVACILCYYHNISPQEALRMTTKFHSQRPVMREKWRKIGSPQSYDQKNFVCNFFKPLKFGSKMDEDSTKGFDMDEPFSLTIKLKGETYNFENASQALQKMYSLFPEKWEEKKKFYMYDILFYKFSQNDELMKKLLNTGLRPLVKISKDHYWGCGKNGQGLNMMGKLLYILRKNLYFQT